jgi:hypothetical protein
MLGNRIEARVSPRQGLPRTQLTLGRGFARVAFCCALVVAKAWRRPGIGLCTSTHARECSFKPFEEALSARGRRRVHSASRKPRIRSSA